MTFKPKEKKHETPIEQMTDDEVCKELADLAKKHGSSEFTRGMLGSGAGERQMLNLYRGMERSQQ